MRVAGRRGVERLRISAKGPREVAPVLQAMTAHHDIVDPVRREFGRVGETFGGAKIFPVVDCLSRLGDQSVFDRDSRNGLAPVDVSRASLLEAAKARRRLFGRPVLDWRGRTGIVCLNARGRQIPIGPESGPRFASRRPRCSGAA